MPTSNKPQKKVQKKKGRPALFEIFRKNFNAALDDAGYPGLHYGRQVEVSKVFKISTSAARKWVMGECIPDWGNMIFIADTLNVSVDALLGRGAKLKSKPMVTIPIGVANPKSTEHDEWFKRLSDVKFEASWLETGMRLKHEDLQLMVVTGNYMSSTLDNGDIIFVDTRAIEEIEDDAIYLFKHSGRQMIRRVRFNLNDTIKLVCDNKQFSEDIIPRSAIHKYQPGEPETTGGDSLSLVGRVQWAIKRVGGDTANSLVELK